MEFTNLNQGFVDKEFKITYPLSTDSVTIVNTLDEDPEYTSLDGSKYQYQHGDVNVSQDQLSMVLYSE